MYFHTASRAEQESGDAYLRLRCVSLVTKLPETRSKCTRSSSSWTGTFPCRKVKDCAETPKWLVKDFPHGQTDGYENIQYTYICNLGRTLVLSVPEIELGNCIWSIPDDGSSGDAEGGRSTGKDRAPFSVGRVLFAMEPFLLLVSYYYIRSYLI